VVEQPESRSPLAVGLDLASRVTTIGLEFALPVAGGYGVDSWLGTMPAGTITGAVLGFLAGMLHAVRMSRELSGIPGKPGPSGRSGPPR
jgi:F0F1-type ATP synthase assembly protein I